MGKSSKPRKKQSREKSSVLSPRKTAQMQPEAFREKALRLADSNLFWSGGVGIVVAAYGFLLSGAPTFGLVLLVVAWIIIAISIFRHNFLESRTRRVQIVGNTGISLFIAFFLGGVWTLVRSQPQERVTAQSAPSPTEQQSLFSSIPSYIVSVGNGACSLFMSSTGSNTKSDPVIMTPIAYLLWVRLLNNTSFKMLVDRYSVQLSESESGPWVNAFSLRIKSGSYYCYNPQGRDFTGSNRAFHAALGSIKGSIDGPKLATSEESLVVTSSDLSCLNKCIPLEMPALDDILISEVEPHTTAAGWVAVNPPLEERPTLARRHAFYRLTVHTATGDFISSGQIGRKTGAAVYRSDAYLRLRNIELDLGHIPLAYVGAK